jgi:integrating conjugative element protein (TIGR03759 family)
MNKRLLPLSVMLFYVLFSVLFACHAAQAQTSSKDEGLRTRDTVIEHSRRSAAEHQAQQWGLQPQEWQRYQELMDGPLGIYSPGLDPLSALGISARDEAERRRYAEMQVMAETQRVERELVYQRAYDDAFRRLYPGLLPLGSLGLPGAGHSGSGSGLHRGLRSGVTDAVLSSGRLAVFVRETCAPCESKVAQLQQAGAAFDLYLVDSGLDDARIRRWATRAGIEPQKVFSRAITLNHDSGRWEALGLGGELPAVLKEVQGRWQRQ